MQMYGTQNREINQKNYQAPQKYYRGKDEKFAHRRNIYHAQRNTRGDRAIVENIITVTWVSPSQALSHFQDIAFNVESGAGST